MMVQESYPCQDSDKLTPVMTFANKTTPDVCPADAINVIQKNKPATLKAGRQQTDL